MTWPAKPDQTAPLMEEWARRFPQWVRLDTVQPWTHPVYSLTVTDWGRTTEAEPRGCLITVPHAHEPAGTVACMEFLSELLEGHSLDRETLLKRSLLSFIPDANPEGRSRSPVPFWDGNRYTNPQFLDIAFGVDPQTGERFPRVDRWTVGENTPAVPGIVYERIDEHTYVEPNRDEGSSYFHLYRSLMVQHRYHQLLELHQTEFEGSPTNCVILLPILWEELPEAIRNYSRAWAEEITVGWARIPGAHPQAPLPLAYTGQQREYFVRRWGETYRTLPAITVEIQNNNPRTPPELQRELALEAIRVSVERLGR